MAGNREQMRQMHSAFEQTQFHPIIDRVFGFDHLKEAYDYASSGDHLGKIVIKVSSS
jgi:NADPH:quinone reductase-like Zn-dependent oxidoreductase